MSDTLIPVRDARPITMHGAQLTERAFIPPDADVSEEVLEQIANQVNAVGRNSMWWVGDLLVWIDEITGDGRWKRYADILGMGEDRVKRARLVSKAYGPFDRLWDMPWHYYETASHVLDVEVRARLLAEADEQRPARGEFRGWVDSVRQPVDPDAPSPVKRPRGDSAAQPSASLQVERVQVQFSVELGFGTQLRKSLPDYMEDLTNQINADGIPLTGINIV